MAHICLFPSTPNVIDRVLTVDGFAYCSDSENDEEIPITATNSWTASQGAVNTAITSAGITAAENAGHTIGVLDNRILIAGAVGL